MKPRMSPPKTGRIEQCIFAARYAQRYLVQEFPPGPPPGEPPAKQYTRGETHLDPEALARERESLQDFKRQAFSETSTLARERAAAVEAARATPSAGDPCTGITVFRKGVRK